jgi:hypothetical protein
MTSPRIYGQRHGLFFARFLSCCVTKEFLGVTRSYVYKYLYRGVTAYRYAANNKNSRASKNERHHSLRFCFRGCNISSLLKLQKQAPSYLSTSPALSDRYSAHNKAEARVDSDYCFQPPDGTNRRVVFVEFIRR